MLKGEFSARSLAGGHFAPWDLAALIEIVCRYASILCVNSVCEMRIFTGWNNPYGGGGKTDISNTLLAEHLKGAPERESNPAIQYARNGL